MTNEQILDSYEDQRAISPADAEDGEDRGCFNCSAKQGNMCEESGKYVTDNSPACDYWEDDDV